MCGSVAPRRLLRGAISRLKHSLAGIAKLGCVLPQAGDDTVRIRNLTVAQPKDIRRAGKLLFESAAIILSLGWHLHGDSCKGHDPEEAASHFRVSLAARYA
jgi:hypothetical protein